MNYDDNPIIQNLRKAYWSVDEDGMAIWDQWKRDSFLKMSPNERRQSLQIVDQYLDTQVRPTPEDWRGGRATQLHSKQTKELQT